MRDPSQAEMQVEPTVDIATGGRIVGVGRNAAYKAAKDGTLPSFKVGGQIRIPTARLAVMLGMSEHQLAQAIARIRASQAGAGARAIAA